MRPSIPALPSRANHLFFHSAPISSSSKTLPTPLGSTTAPMSLRLHRLEATPTQTSTALAQRPLRHLLPLPLRPLPLPSSRPPALNRPSRLEGSELRLFSLPLLLSRCLKKSRTLATLEGSIGALFRSLATLFYVQNSCFSRAPSTYFVFPSFPWSQNCGATRNKKGLTNR